MRLHRGLVVVELVEEKAPCVGRVTANVELPAARLALREARAFSAIAAAKASTYSGAMRKSTTRACTMDSAI